VAIKSVYWPDPEIRGGLLSVDGEEHQHLKVSRTGVGEGVEVFDGEGRVWEGQVARRSSTSTEIRIRVQRSLPPPAEIILAQALIKNAAFEWVLEKAVEVGVTRIIPFRSERSNVLGPGREKRWKRIIVEAAKQSKHYYLPRLDAVTDIKHVLAVDGGSKIVFALESEGPLESALSDAPVVYMIGPEGGWADEELEAARSRGFVEVRLGPHIMRAETAAIVAGGLIAHQLGVL
jgi:16S rRNA (uracil1498-N3)-methyltransferase